MISAYRTGLVAGNTISHHPELTIEAQKIAAQEEIAKRKKLGIAHLFPEEEFIKGFLDGYHMPSSLSDGLTLYSKL